MTLQNYMGHLPKLKTWGKVKYCYHGSQLMEKCLAQNMIKEAIFKNIFLIQVR